MRSFVFVSLVGALLTSVPGCDTPNSSDQELGNWVDAEGRLIYRGYVDNSEVTNGFEINGFRINGFRINGVEGNGFRINGFRINGTGLLNVLMQNNSLRAEDASQNVLEGKSLEDLRVDIEHVDPDNEEDVTNIEVRQTEVETLATGLVLQTVTRRVLPHGNWENACENGAKSILLKGAWDDGTAQRVSADPDRTTWACAGAALGDCALWGYVPGQVYDGTPLEDYHQACVRLKRADYCGNGVHHTENGHSIDVYDKKNIMTPATIGTWAVEGMWGPSGAICLSFTRKSQYSLLPGIQGKTYIGCEIPPCVDHNSDGVIDFQDYPEAVLANRTVPS